MKPALLAVLLAFAAAARSQQGAYVTLVSMAEAAKEERGRTPGDGTDDRARASSAEKKQQDLKAAAAPAAGEELRDAPADMPARPVAPAAAARADAPRASAPVAAARKAWTRLSAALTPSGRVVLSYNGPAVSTGTARAAAAAPAPIRLLRPDPGVKAGEARGLDELMSAAAAPAIP